MKKERNKEYSILFDSNRMIQKKEMQAIRGGSICGNAYIGVPTAGMGGPMLCDYFYLGWGEQD